MAIQLHRLEGFYRVAIAGGYARAARQFPYPISQPAVHQQVRKLERELGVKLFERVAKDRVIPTQSGRLLLTFCAPFFERLPQVIHDITGAQIGGELRIDTSGLALHQLLPRWLTTLRKKHPELEVSLQEVDHPQVQRLMHGEADIIVDYWPDAPIDLQRRTIAYAHGFVVMPAEHRLAQRKHFNLCDFGDDPFVGYHRRLPHSRLQWAELRRLGITPARTLCASSADSILSFVAAGLGYSLIPWLDPRGPKRPNVVARPYGDNRQRLPIDAVWRTSPLDNSAIGRALGCVPTSP
ncbi:MAG TPA: LysR family transcriptional regulator [Sorangium sp.]|nr:LysR family transcriptional regulator [Sorangium sp.]